MVREKSPKHKSEKAVEPAPAPNLKMAAIPSSINLHAQNINESNHKPPLYFNDIINDKLSSRMGDHTLKCCGGVFRVQSAGGCQKNVEALYF